MQVNLSIVDLIVVGGMSADLAAAVADYEKRLSRYVRFSVHELKGVPLQRGERAVVAAESERIAASIAAISRDEAHGVRRLAVCDITGAQLDSPALAKQLLDASRLTIVIGGACGITSDIVRGADLRISFGRITLPHQIARLVCTEQLYRCFRIARNEPYHY